MHEIVGNNSSKNKEEIKKLIKKLHAGEDPAVVKEEFRDLIKNLTQAEISQAEEQLIKEGMPVEEIHHMCEVHLSVLQDKLIEDQNLAPKGHPIHILMQEHALLLENVNRLRDLYSEIKIKADLNEVSKELDEIKNIVKMIKSSENHYLREENVLFSYAEKYGLTQPPKIMWMEHDRIRDIEKQLFQLMEDKEDMSYRDFLEQYHLHVHGLAELLASHFSKENKVLFPTCIQLFKETDWVNIRKQFDKIGYFFLTPDTAILEEKTEKSSEIINKSLVDLGSGKLDLETLQQIFKTLPFDTTFVDKDDIVRFYSEGKDRIFVRTPSVIGRLVENCHPRKSVDKVMSIIKGFKENNLDKAEFWLTLDDKLVMIRYFPVRNSKGEYLGVLEVTQDITKIQKLKGEKRLL